MKKLLFLISIYGFSIHAERLEFFNLQHVNSKKNEVYIHVYLTGENKEDVVKKFQLDKIKVIDSEGDIVNAEHSLSQFDKNITYKERAFETDPIEIDEIQWSHYLSYKLKKSIKLENDQRNVAFSSKKKLSFKPLVFKKIKKEDFVKNFLPLLDIKQLSLSFKEKDGIVIKRKIGFVNKNNKLNLLVNRNKKKLSFELYEYEVFESIEKDWIYIYYTGISGISAYSCFRKKICFPLSYNIWSTSVAMHGPPLIYGPRFTIQDGKETSFLLSDYHGFFQFDPKAETIYKAKFETNRRLFAEFFEKNILNYEKISSESYHNSTLYIRNLLDMKDNIFRNFLDKGCHSHKPEEKKKCKENQEKFIKKLESLSKDKINFN